MFKNNLIIFFLILLCFSNFGLADKISEIKVVSDDKYPPYIYRDMNGKLIGIIPELWKKWEEKTGVKVKLVGMDWAYALKEMAEGKADVLETVFLTEERARIWQFTKPYAKIDVPIFYSKSIREINSFDELLGFNIGVKSGDACINELKKIGLTILQEFGSYDEIARAALENKIKVFCIDEPPALYYLQKYDLLDEFNKTAPLYSGYFHRATKKDDQETFNLVTKGFELISKDEEDSIFNKYLAVSVKDNNWSKYFYIIAGVLLSISILLMINRLYLKRILKSKTLELSNIIKVLQKKDRELKEIMNNLFAYVSIKDLQGRFLFVNKQIEKLLNRKENEIIGKSLYDFLQKEDADAIIETEKIVIQEKQLKIFNEIIYINGEPRNYISKRFPLFDEKGECYAICFIGEDVTEKIKYEEELKSMMNNLNESNKAKDKFFSIIAHDLKSPFQGLMGFINILNNDYEILDDNQKRKFLQNIKSITDNIYQLIEKLLNWSRLQIGKFEIKLDKLNLFDAINHIKNLLIGNLVRKNISFEVHIDKNLNVLSDENVLRTVLENVISNAIKFTRRDGKIIVSATNEKDFIKLSVKDNGVGIKKNDLEMLFRIDAQVTTTGTDQEKGTGLGLLLCKEMIEKQGGKIYIESKYNEGTTVHIEFKKAN